MEYHPDKAGAAVADEDKKREIEAHFQKIQDAYETLSDPAKRREYDSTDDFDDTLPSTAHPSEFFKVCVQLSLQGTAWTGAMLCGKSTFECCSLVTSSCRHAAPVACLPVHLHL